MAELSRTGAAPGDGQMGLAASASGDAPAGGGGDGGGLAESAPGVAPVGGGGDGDAGLGASSSSSLTLDTFVTLARTRSIARRWRAKAGLSRLAPAPAETLFAALLPRQHEGRLTGKQLWMRLRMAVHFGLASRMSLDAALSRRKAARAASDMVAHRKVVTEVRTARVREMAAV